MKKMKMIFAIASVLIAAVPAGAMQIQQRGKQPIYTITINVVDRTTKAMVRLMSIGMFDHSLISIGQYTMVVAGWSTPSSRSFPTTPMISRQGSSWLCVIRLPSASAGVFQYSRARFSETTTTGLA